MLVKDKISIIMGVHNGSDRFIEALKSIEDQTYENWEFIICDDGSTDDTYEKLIEYTKSNKKYKIIRNESNKGLAATLNHCIEYCDGEYIARMDDDDISYPDRFESQINYLKTNKDLSFVSSSVDIYDGKQVVTMRKLKPYPTKYNLIYGSQFVHPATLFKADVLKEIGGYRVSWETTRGQDYDLFMRLYGAGYKGGNLQNPVFRYTESSSSFKKRTFKARVGEFKIRVFGYKAMNVLFWAFPFTLKPFVAWFVTVLKKK